MFHTLLPSSSSSSSSSSSTTPIRHTSSTIQQQYENFTIFGKLGYNNIEINGPIENVWKLISSDETKIVIFK